MKWRHHVKRRLLRMVGLRSPSLEFVYGWEQEMKKRPLTFTRPVVMPGDPERPAEPIDQQAVERAHADDEYRFWRYGLPLLGGGDDGADEDTAGPGGPSTH